MAILLKPANETSILVVDDNPDNLRLLSKMLEAEGYTIRKSLTGKMALQSAHRDPPDLILLDITMPEMNGYEVCLELKNNQKTENVPVIFISALDQISDKVQAFEMGGQDYITKPFQELEVLMRVKNQLLIYQQHQKLIEQNQRLAAEIQERLKAEAEIRRLALTDELTGLYNRRGFFFLANQQLKISQRNQMDSCLLFIDLDGLKQINDSFGHEVGDEAIANIAKMLQQVFRDSDIIARLGGDEFVIFVPICTMNSEDVLSRLQTVIDKFNQTHQYPYYLSISMGMIQCRLNSDISLERLIEKADTLMYEHKRQKRQAAANLSTHDSIG